MNFRTTFILFVILIVLGTVILFTRQNSAPVNVSSTSDGAKLVDLPSASVNKLSITPAGEKTIVLERDGINWKLTEPLQSPAENSVVTQLVDDLLNLKTRGQLSADQTKSARTGLDEARFRIEIGTEDGRSRKLAVGQRTASGDNLYVQRSDEATAMIVPGAILDQLDRPVTALRRKKLFDVSPQQIRQVQIKVQGKIISLSKDPKTNHWQMEGAGIFPGDEREITDYLLALTELSASDFPAEKIDDVKPYHLQFPQLEVWFSTQSPTTQPAAGAEHTVKFGGFIDVSKRSVYASESDSRALLSIAATAMDALKKSPLDLRDRDLVTIDPKLISNVMMAVDHPATTQPTTQPASHRQIIISRLPAPTTAPATQPATTQSATRPSLTWTISEAEKVTSTVASDRAVEAFVQMFHPLHVERFLETPATTQPAARVVMTIETIAPGGATQTYAFSFVLGENGRGEYDGAIFEPPRALLDALDRGDFTHAPAPPEEPNEQAFPQPR